MTARGSSTAIKLVVFAIISLLLSLGLCSFGGGFDTHVTNLQIACTYIGAGCFILALILFAMGISESRRRCR